MTTPRKDGAHRGKANYKKGTGALNNHSVLTMSQVKDIKYSYDVSIVELSRRYGVSHQTIRKIITGKTWKHVY